MVDEGATGSVIFFFGPRLDERLLEVGPELVRILEPDREAEQALRDAVALPAVRLSIVVSTPPSDVAFLISCVAVSTFTASGTSNESRPPKPG